MLWVVVEYLRGNDEELFMSVIYRKLLMSIKYMFWNIWVILNLLCCIGFYFFFLNIENILE